MERIEEFTRDGKTFFYFDLSGFKSNDQFIQVIEDSKPMIAQHPEHSVYTVTNIANVRFDTKTKELVAEWTAHNKPYVKYVAVVGMDGIKKIMVNAIFAISGRKNMNSASTRDEAVAWLLKQG